LYPGLQAGVQIAAVDMLHWSAIERLHCRHLDSWLPV
jgi:hypothetical protein